MTTFKISSLVSSQWLANALSDSDIVVVDCRFKLSDPLWGYEQYLHSHIPGAYYLNLDLDLSAPVKPHGGRHPLCAPSVLTEKLGSFGISSDTLVVAYDDSRFAFAARLWWLMKYIGHTKVALLDGGFPGWVKGGFLVSKVIPPLKPTTSVYKLQPNLLVDFDTVNKIKDSPGVVLIDSRESARYLGLTEPIDPVAGHIPGAVNSPWTQVSNSEGYFLPLETHLQLWQPYQQAQEIIVYCGSGVTACVNLFSLQIAGFSQAKLYPGGWSDWCSYLH